MRVPQVNGPGARHQDPISQGPSRLAIVSHSQVARANGHWLVKNRIGEIIDGLPGLDWKVTLISRRSDELPFLTHRLSADVSILALDGFTRPRQIIRLLRAVRKADRVLIFMPSVFCAVVALLVGRRAVVYAGHSWVMIPDTPAWRGRLEALAARRASEVIVAGDALLRRFQPVARKTSLYVPLVHDEVSERLRSGALLGRTHRPLRVLYVGSIARRDKGAADLVEAAVELTDVECRLVGAISDDFDCTRLLARISGLSHVEFCGYLDWPELREQYEWADVLVLPSYSEGFPRVAYEATAFGVALVVTPVGGVPHHLRAGLDAIFIPVDNPEGIRKALQYLLAEPGRTRTLVQGAHEALAPLFRDDDPVSKFDRALRAA